MSREVMQQALDAMHSDLATYNIPPTARMLETITALREALAQPEQIDWEAVAADQAMTIALLKSEQPAQRHPLTDEQIGLLTTGDGWAHLETPALALFARAIEAAHGIGGNHA